jgi:predicted nucleotidyltransferase
MLEEIAAREAEHLANYAEDGLEKGLLLDALDGTKRAVDRTGVDHIFVGGIAAATFGRPRVTHDVDVMVRPEDARTVLHALAERGFRTEERFPHWLFKAYNGPIEIDVIFRSSGDVYLDAEMLERAVDGTFEGRPVRLISPEDLVVMKALAHEEHCPRHWHDALGVLARTPLDWDYLLERARVGPRRVLSLLLYAQSNDLPVPSAVVKRLFQELDDG